MQDTKVRAEITFGWTIDFSGCLAGCQYESRSAETQNGIAGIASIAKGVNPKVGRPLRSWIIRGSAGVRSWTGCGAHLL